MIDAHCHLDRCVAPAEALDRARAAGVTGLVLAGVDPDGWAAQAALVAAHPGLVRAAGVHPEVVAESSPDQVEAMLAVLEVHLAAGGVVAVGVTGLDHRREHADSHTRQLRAFQAQLQMARALGLPVVLHVVRAHGAALDALAPFAPLRGMVHSFSGSAEVGARYLALGLHLSFAGPVASPASHKVRAAAAACPPDRLLVETDAPDQLPMTVTAVENEPAFLGAVVVGLADARGEEASDLARRCADNARALFGL